MKRKLLAELIPLLAKGIAPATAVATSLFVPFAQAATGDLDPAFADVGRLGPIVELQGSAWSLESLEEGGTLFAGGDLSVQCNYWFCYYEVEFQASNFVESLTDGGAIDASYHAQDVPGIEVFDIARQADGKVVAAGRKVSQDGYQMTLAVFRLNADGSLDQGFGEAGVFELTGEAYGVVHMGQAIALEPDGRIAVAGAREIASGNTYVSELILLRLQADGSLDESFGAAGAYIGPTVDFGVDVRLARTAAGTYRVAAPTASGCAILGVTSTGALDGSFGGAGIALVESPLGDPVACRSLAAQADGSLLVAGSSSGHGFAARLNANGARDTSFEPDAAVADSMNDATSVVAAADGKVLVAGSGLRGASIMRLQATGELDSLFGNGGQTWIDLPSDFETAPVVHDMALRADGGVIAAGADLTKDRPFIIRLLGDDGGDSPGVLSFIESNLTPAEADGQAVVHVRRSGGSAGDVSIDYHTVATGGAIAGEDFTPASGTLHWADGDATEREIIVAIADDDGAAESFEGIRIGLGNATGGAGAGTRNVMMEIQPDGAPAGQITFDYVQDIASESGVAQLWVTRNFYAEGEVSVTLTPESVTAASGTDFDPDPVTITWASGESGAKLVEIALPDDSVEEESETFMVELSDPTGGAILGTYSSGVIAIDASDRPRLTVPPGGGGAAGFLSLLLLGLAELKRSARRALYRRT